MAVKLVNAKIKNEKKEVLNFNSKDFMAVKGGKGSFFEGKIKVVHRNLGKTLIGKKLATEEKAEVVKEENLNRSVKDIAKK